MSKAKPRATAPIDSKPFRLKRGCAGDPPRPVSGFVVRAPLFRVERDMKGENVCWRSAYFETNSLADPLNWTCLANISANQNGFANH